MIRAIKKLGFAVKLDTNGSRPEIVEQLLTEKTVDYWAIDRKASLARYPLLTGIASGSALVEKTSQMIRQATDEHEFRTTVIREFHSPEEIELIGKELTGARRLVLQQFRPHVTLDPQLYHSTAYTSEEMDALCSRVRPYVQETYWR
jgi:pyruvate formate lyase activating enzyme